MLKLLFAEHYSDVEIDILSFVEEYLPCMKFVRAPIEVFFYFFFKFMK